LIGTNKRNFNRWAFPVGHEFSRDSTGHPMGVTDIVELAELALKLPKPAFVSHPVRAQVYEPRLSHPAGVI
jgi:hypothetical protein